MKLTAESLASLTNVSSRRSQRRPGPGQKRVFVTVSFVDPPYESGCSAIDERMIVQLFTTGR